MDRDILFKTDSLVFSYRVGGIAVRGGHILLQKPKNDDCAVIGGHVRAMETGEEALKREFREELRTEIEVERLIAAGEIFFPWDGRPCHQICLYYDITLPGSCVPEEGAFSGYDEIGNERIDLDYIWVPLEDLGKGTVLYPRELVPYILEPRKEIVHFVSRYL